jgi:hypothetical protein
LVDFYKAKDEEGEICQESLKRGEVGEIDQMV